MDVKDILIRASSSGYIMTEPQAKKDREEGNLSKTALNHCIDLFTSWYYGRREEMYSKYLEKGNEVEEDSITLLSLLTGKMYYKNEHNFRNEYISGTPDLFVMDGDRVDVIEDIKSAYDIFTFQRSKHEGIKSNYYWQLQCYMALTGAKKANIRYCLVNATASLIDDEKRKTAYAMRVIDDLQNDEYIKRCKQIEKNMIYDIKLFEKHYPGYDLLNDTKEWSFDIPRDERMFTQEVEFDSECIELLYSKVEKCRQFIKTLIPTK